MTSEKSHILVPTKRIYCLDCEWAASAENHSRRELSTLAIEHAVEQGHDIDSEIIYNGDVGSAAIGCPTEARLN